MEYGAVLSVEQVDAWVRCSSYNRTQAFPRVLPRPGTSPGRVSI